MNQPFVSILTPVYNGERFLADCIESVLAQTYKNWEYIILNNASTDATGTIARRYAQQDSRVRLIESDHCLPVIQNWNRALQLISPASQYCKIVHADDFIRNRCIEKMVMVAEQDPRIGIVGAQRLNGDSIDLTGLATDCSIFDGRRVCRDSLMNGLYVFGAPTALLLRSDIIRRSPRFYDEDFLHADTAVCYRILRDWKLGFVHEPLTYIRIHDQSISTRVASRTEFANYFSFESLVMLERYGKAFLTDPEYRRLMVRYRTILYRHMARHWLRRGGGETLKYQRRGLEKFGFPFSRISFVQAAAAVIFECVRQPHKLVRQAALFGASVGRGRVTA